ncbi:MAG: hypothetical protein JHC31_15885 [Sulfurihydrogenibium sp.]|jgi:hypothetical protein|nr:hypothetical protein [Sulfurihydrogenibium sp.]
MEINKKRLIKELLEKDKTLENDIDKIFEAIEKIESFKRRKSTKIKLSNDAIMEISKKTSGFYPAYFFKWKDKVHYYAVNPYEDINY